MTRLDAEYLEYTTFINYNKPHYSKFMGYQLDNKKLHDFAFSVGLMAIFTILLFLMCGTFSLIDSLIF